MTLLKTWFSELSGYACRVAKGPVGALCGYVIVPPGHPWHGCDYGDEPVAGHIYDLTYSGNMFKQDVVGWAFGFDHGHVEHILSVDTRNRNTPIVYMEDLEAACQQVMDLDKVLYAVQKGAGTIPSTTDVICEAMKGVETVPQTSIESQRADVLKSFAK